MRTGSRGAQRRAGAVVLLTFLLAACGTAQADPRSASASPSALTAGTATTATAGATAGRPASPGPVVRTSGGAAAPAALPTRYATAQDLGAAVVRAVRARGSVLIVTTAQGTPLVSRRSVELGPAGQNTSSQLSMPGRPDRTLLVADDVPYLSVDDDVPDPRWHRTRFDDLAHDPTWASAVYAVDLPTELRSWGLAVALSGGDAGTLAGEQVRTYTLTLGPQAATAQVRLDRVAPADRPGVTERLSQMRYDLTVTLGADDLPRTVTTIAPTSGLLTTQTYTGWGSVSVRAPSSDAVLTS